MPTVRVQIAGMTCRSCEVRVTRRLQGLDGVSRVSVSARTGTAEITSRRTVPRGDLVRAIERAGYSLADQNGRRARPWLSHDRQVWRDAAIALALGTALILALNTAGAPLLDRLQELFSTGNGAGLDGGAAGSAGLLVVLALGVAAGFSTCMALVGGLVMAVSAAHARRNPGGSLRSRLRPHLAFNAGRVIGFTLLGAGLGAVGSVVALDGWPLAVAMVLVALVMGAIGLRLTQLSPRLGDGPGLTLPPRLALALRLDTRIPTGDRYGDLRAAGLGAATFLLPCGFTQAVQVLAVSTGSPWRAAAVMGVFALGTTPGLLAIGGVTAGVRGRIAAPAFRYAGVAVLGFAVVNLVAATGILLPGLTFGGTDSSPSTVSSNVRVVGDEQVLSTTQDLEGYAPAESTVYAGLPVRWKIESTSMGCASYLDARSLGIDKVMLDFGPNELTFTPGEPGTYRYSCAMGMYHGVVHVIPRPAPLAATT